MMLQNTFLVAERRPGNFTLPGGVSTEPDAHMAGELMTSNRIMMKPAQQPGEPETPDSWTMLDSMFSAYAGQAGHESLLELTPCGPITELRPGDKVIVLCNSEHGITAREVTLRPDDCAEARA